MKKLLVLPAAALAFLPSFAAFGQFETASVLGYVRDASGASVPDASVSLINEVTKAVVTLKTNGQGGVRVHRRKDRPV